MMDIFLYVYFGFALLSGLMLAVSSKRFAKMSLWKQLLVLSISPLLMLREFIFTMKRR